MLLLDSGISLAVILGFPLIAILLIIGVSALEAFWINRRIKSFKEPFLVFITANFVSTIVGVIILYQLSARDSLPAFLDNHDHVNSDIMVYILNKTKMFFFFLALTLVVEIPIVKRNLKSKVRIIDIIIANVFSYICLAVIYLWHFYF